MTRIVCISDTHSLHSSVVLPEGDIVVSAGDITNMGDLIDVESFGKWVTSFGHKKIITIWGNHDFCGQDESRFLAKQILEDYGVVLLEDSEVIFDGLKFYGSPWQPEFGGWAFNKRRGEELRKVWELIPVDTDVLITHGPPAGILDFAEYGQEHTGCVDLLNRIQKLEKLKLSVFGHIHEDAGQIEKNGVKFVNASICTLQYKPTNLPITIDI